MDGINNWLKIEDYPDYYISDNGDVVSYKNGSKVYLTKCKDNYGYYVVALFNKYGRKTKKVHRLVALAFVSNPQNKETVNHINGIKTDNRVLNLEWSTSKENTEHANNTGLTNIKGENHVNSVTNEKTVLALRKKRKEDGTTYINLAKEFNLTVSTVADILKRRTWKHI